MTTTNTPIDLLNPVFKADPFPTYAELRQHAPVYRAALPDGTPVWLVTRYDDVQTVLRDERFVKNFRSALTPEQLAAFPPIPAEFATLNNNMLDRDPPDHTRLRALVSKAFTPRMIEHLRPRVQEIADELLDGIQVQEEMDVIAAYAFPLPITVICEMLGIPVADRDQFRRWSNTLVGSAGSPDDPVMLESATAFTAYLRALVAERRAARRTDLISGLIAAEDGGDTLHEDELLAMIFLLLVAGHETTVNLIGNGMLALFEHGDQLEKLKSDPRLIKSAVEELLRYTGPVETATERYAREDMVLGGVTIPRGEMVLAVLASAGRDEDKFKVADRLDITREPNRHMAFGQGIHFCLGAPLARMEGQIAITTLLRRLSNLRLAVPVEELHWRPGLVLRGLQALPVAF